MLILCDRERRETDKRIYLRVDRIHHDVEVVVGKRTIQIWEIDGHIAKRQTEIPQGACAGGRN